ncbi:MAG: hypothetical protein GXO18_04740 [Aquificae bacterium]|nr:hypothetical protein [Aquificota bacterium]
MRNINSPNSFKTCYIAAVKEELGLLKHKRKNKRKIKPPPHLRWAIEEALKRKPDAKYKEIQKLAFAILKEKERKELPFFGSLGKVNESLLKEIINNKELAYED